MMVEPVVICAAGVLLEDGGWFDQEQQMGGEFLVDGLFFVDEPMVIVMDKPNGPVMEVPIVEMEATDRGRSEGRLADDVAINFRGNGIGWWTSCWETERMMAGEQKGHEQMDDLVAGCGLADERKNS